MNRALFGSQSEIRVVVTGSMNVAMVIGVSAVGEAALERWRNESAELEQYIQVCDGHLGNANPGPTFRTNC